MHFAQVVFREQQENRWKNILRFLLLFN